MALNNKKAFTIVELMIGIAILSIMIGVAIIFMARGASNVQKGSFNALAANQAAWICAVIRNDIARSDSDNIIFGCDAGEPWNGNKDFKVNIEGGTVTYSIEERGKNKVFIRNFVAGSSAFDNKRQVFGDEFMTDMSVTRSDDGSHYVINITMDERKKDDNDNAEKHDFVWNATIYPPIPSGLGKYWVPTMSDEN